MDRYFPHVADGELETAVREVITKWIDEDNEVPALPKYLHDRLIKPLEGYLGYLSKEELEILELK